MTKEEAIKVLHNALYGGGNAFVMSEFRDAIKLALNTLQQEHVPQNREIGTLSLPSNLDEVAEEIVKDWNAYGDGEYKKLVITGAEWMAGQGESRDDIVVMENFDGKAHIFPIPSSNFNPGDRVVVQIRKKQ